MNVKQFIVKTFVITSCLIVLSYFWMPQYQLIDKDTRFNCITGKKETWGYYGNSPAHWR